MHACLGLYSMHRVGTPSQRQEATHARVDSDLSCTEMFPTAHCGPHAAVVASDSLKARVRCGSAAYWAIALSLVPLTGAVSAASALVLVRNYNRKTRGGHDLAVGEVIRAQGPACQCCTMTFICTSSAHMRCS